MARSESSFEYLAFVPAGDIRYGPGEFTAEKENVARQSIESFEYCHQQSDSAMSFAMQNEISLTGILGVFGISASHASQYETAWKHARQEGQGEAKLIDSYAKSATKETYELEKDQVLVKYARVTACCFHTGDGLPRYLHVPTGDVVVRPMNQKQLQKLGHEWWLDNATWNIITKDWFVPTVSVKQKLELLKPKLASPPPKVPLNLWWNSDRQDNVTCSSEMGNSDAEKFGYHKIRVEGWVHPEQAPGTVPLNLWWNSDRQDNVTCSSEEGNSDAEKFGYHKIRVEGFVYPKQAPGTVPLTLWWHPDRQDNVTCSSEEGNSDAEKFGYHKIRVEGFVYPDGP